MSAVVREVRPGVTLETFLPPPIRLLMRGVKVDELVAQLEAQPELWDRNRFRTAEGYGNPHKSLSDIIVRYRDWSEWTGDRRSFVDPPHESVWWSAYSRLPAIKPLVFDLARWLEATQIGTVLITRIPPHTTCGRHTDAGWAAEHYVKYALSLKANEKQEFCFDDRKLMTKPGDLFMFDNARAHWVTNPTDEDRWTLIICLRTGAPVCTNDEWSGPT